VQKWFDGSQAQEKEEKTAYAPQQRNRNQRQPRQQKGWSGQKSRDKTSDVNLAFDKTSDYSKYKYMDGYGVDPEPSHIAEFVSKWCMESPSGYAQAKPGSNAQLGEIMKDFGNPYHGNRSGPPKVGSDMKMDPIASLLANNAPPQTGSGFQGAPLWIMPNQQAPPDPWVSPFDSFGKSEKKDAIWNIDNTFLLNGFGKTVPTVDQGSEFHQVKQSFLDIEPKKVYPSCV
jgi:hypothetical protein